MGDGFTSVVPNPPAHAQALSSMAPLPAAHSSLPPAPSGTPICLMGDGLRPARRSFQNTSAQAPSLIHGASSLVQSTNGSHFSPSGTPICQRLPSRTRSRRIFSSSGPPICRRLPSRIPSSLSPSASSSHLLFLQRSNLPAAAITHALASHLLSRHLPAARIFSSSSAPICQRLPSRTRSRRIFSPAIYQRLASSLPPALQSASGSHLLSLQHSNQQLPLTHTFSPSPLPLPLPLTHAFSPSPLPALASSLPPSPSFSPSPLPLPLTRAFSPLRWKMPLLGPSPTIRQSFQS